MDLPSFRTDVREAIARCRGEVERFLALPEETPFRTVVQGFDGLTLPLNGWSGRVALYTHVHPEVEVREACEELEREIAALGTELSLDRRLWERRVSSSAKRTKHSIPQRAARGLRASIAS